MFDINVSQTSRMDAAEMARLVNAYVDDNRGGLPILKECCLLHGWDFDEFVKLAAKDKELKRAVNRLLCQKEVNLEKGGVLGDFNKSMTALLLRDIFREKELDRESESLEKLDLTLSRDAELAEIGMFGPEGFDDDG